MDLAYLLSACRNDHICVANDSPIKDVGQMSVVCTFDSFFQRVASKQIINEERKFFMEIKANEKQFAYIDAVLDNDELRTNLNDVQDPSAYIFRRNFVTIMSILQLDESEIQYTIGHDIEDNYEKRNDFLNEDRIYEIKKKLQYRPAFNAVSAAIKAEQKSICRKHLIMNASIA